MGRQRDKKREIEIRRERVRQERDEEKLRTDNQSFGIDFKKENGDRVAFVGTSSSLAILSVRILILQI